jgi:DNA end-binding protein Ku
MVNPATDETVGPDEMRRGVEVERGVLVTLSERELEGFELEPSRDIHVHRFVQPDELDQRLYERPYLLGPERTQTARYSALARALADSGRAGIASWTMRNREYNGALRLAGGHLALVALRSAEELLPVDRLGAAAGRELDARELSLARQLVAALAGPFEPAEFRDEYRERLLKYIEQKRRGKRVKLRRFKAQPVEDDALVAALERSLERAG